ncbi:acyl-CoA dehydrogenase family protein [Thermomonospora curvata]|uniref:Acyl-CoA dehydrogenase domain protein n=1 Tax=Thermomonospora curvata (strain ATCC 19995 / DSM 43183 / JCM 3096 / KCTC 9072 / NBRC 15933 / NCIMB 10081 / Henssen B9) TaxID=471852 RepID=D1A2N1_THECD|nr:acyl-CoA dehydrogenase family protein [Thermomonospora curvata]ACY96051.1 acyl-CoA dehydrogenase domain protein [Thermomonospora curvata DSM 43183]
MFYELTDGIELTDEQREFVALARDFARNEIRPRAREVDEADTEAPMDLWYKAAEVGLTSYMLPAEYGGGGVTDLVTQCLVQEELCHGDIGIANFLTSSSFFADPILELGTEEQKKKWITPLTGSEPPVTSVAVTEPGVGSDAAGLQTRAVRDGDHYVLNGVKTWISNAPLSQYFVVFATVDPSKRARGVTAFLVERDREGVTVGAPMKKYGQRGTLNAEVFLENVRVPVENRLGEEGKGFYGLMRTFDASRILIGAAATGLSRAILEDAVQYAKERTQFGKPIIEHQAVAFRLADMAAKTDISHLVTMRAARLFDAGKPVTAASAIAKVVASENTTWVANAGLLTHGGWGYSREFMVEKWLRDAKLEELEEGTSDIQRLIISRSLAK